MPPFTKTKIELVPARGLRVDATELDRLDAAIELTLHYRGDVTIGLAASGGGGDEIRGYVFDIKPHDDRKKSVIRIIPSNGSPRVSIPLCDVAHVDFTGRDNASGKSFDTWMHNYVEKKLAGERAGIESDPID